MPSRLVRNIRHVLWLLLLSAVAACDNVSIEGPDSGSTVVESGAEVWCRVPKDITIAPGMKVFAFNSEGRCKAETDVASLDSATPLSLSSNTYSLSFFAGISAYEMPEKPSAEAIVRPLPPYNTSISPLLYAVSEVTIGKTPATLRLSGDYAVCSFSLDIANVPDDVSALSILISPLYSGISLKGEHTGSSTAELPCHPNEGLWSTGEVYLMPSITDSPCLTIRATYADGEVETYDTPIPQPLQAGMSYALVGDFLNLSHDQFNGSAGAIGWGETVSEEFHFGPGATDDRPIGGGGEDYVEEKDVDSIPIEGSVWSGHVVVFVQDNEALLLALNEVEGVGSAFNPAYTDSIETYSKGYSEWKLKGWRLPTRDEALALRDFWGGDRIDDLNGLIISAKGTPMILTEANGKNARYLCEAGTYSFSMAPKTSVTAAGKTVKTYHLRLVKPVRFKLKPAN